MPTGIFLLILSRNLKSVCVVASLPEEVLSCLLLIL